MGRNRGGTAGRIPISTPTRGSSQTRIVDVAFAGCEVRKTTAAVFPRTSPTRAPSHARNGPGVPAATEVRLTPHFGGGRRAQIEDHYIAMDPGPSLST